MHKSVTLVVYFINILRTAFTCADPKSVEKTVKLSIFFTLSGSSSIKAVHRILMKLTPDPKSAKKTVKFSVFFALSGSVLAKAARRTLMK
jgi:hypothetical protein